MVREVLPRSRVDNALREYNKNYRSRIGFALVVLYYMLTGNYLSLCKYPNSGTCLRE